MLVSPKEYEQSITEFGRIQDLSYTHFMFQMLYSCLIGLGFGEDFAAEKYYSTNFVSIGPAFIMILETKSRC